MISTALIYFLVSVGVFLLLVVVTSVERKRGSRVFAGSLRTTLDTKLATLYQHLAQVLEHFFRYIVQLHWYYSIHSVLKTLLRIVVAVYTGLESFFERNRKRAKALRAEKRQQTELTHLEQVSAHKAETALTPTEQRKLRDKQLEGKY